MYLRAFKEQLLSGPVEARPHDGEYISRFERWDALASVRRRPRRDFEGKDPGHFFFPPELYPVVLHPMVASRGEGVVRGLLLQRLYDYLDFTTELENLAVIPVATKISRGRSGLNLPEHMRADAHKIVTDEAWHAQFSDDFARQIATSTGSARLGAENSAGPSFVTRLDELRDQLPHALRGVEGLLFGIVSETLISGILSDIPRDDRLPSAVRELVRDHAEDEGRHHVYFRSVLRHLWPALTPSERRDVGPLVPGAIHAFLEPDYDRAAYHLGGIGLSRDEIDQVISESWPAHQVRHDISAAASQLTRYFAEVGALDDVRTRDSFAQAGLVGTVRESEQTGCTPREVTA
ncbi:para-aminobenzoate N-oxygenase AurF [Streptomyces sp. Ag109_G2-6]|uniref:diiron oxygenase n=1 Tax=Streptomyces TaxID=1883 RepID=UPI000FBB3131|nr:MULTISPECIES: diiron oxygenase [Streptomyces]RPF41841.1 para-aminobenzoate N-oxygenase AurF [Streptomyces sp. Ag109_G2-6]